MEEDKDFDIPVELRKEIIDIMNDNPDIKLLGNKEYRVYNLRMYSLNRILKLALDLCQSKEDEIKNDREMMFALCTDLDRGCEIIAIILCNHLFTPNDIKMDNIEDIYSRNDKLVQYMKAKVMMSTFDNNQWAALILGAIKSIDLSQVFTLLVLVKRYSVSLTNARMKAEEQLQSWQEAQSGI